MIWAPSLEFRVEWENSLSTFSLTFTLAYDVLTGVCVWIAGMLSKSKTSNKPWSLSHNFKISSPEKCLFCTFARWLFCSSKLILYFHCKEFSAPTLFCPLYLYVLQELVQKVWDYLFKVVYHPTLAFSCNLKLLHLLHCLLFFPTNEK